MYKLIQLISPEGRLLHLPLEVKKLRAEGRGELADTTARRCAGQSQAQRPTHEFCSHCTAFGK